MTKFIAYIKFPIIFIQNDSNSKYFEFKIINGNNSNQRELKYKDKLISESTRTH